MSRSRLPMRRLCLCRALLVLAAVLMAPVGAVSARAQPQPGSEAPAVAAQPAQGAPAEVRPDAPPAVAPAPAAGSASDGEDAAADPFGEEVVLTSRTVVTRTGTATWEAAFDALTDSFKKLMVALEVEGLKPAGPFIAVYTATDDAGFTYVTQVPVETAPKKTPDGIGIGKSPEGRMLKFVHRGSYDNMDNTYEAITNHLEERKLEAKDMFIEEYVTDPLTTAEDKLVIHVFVPLK